MEGIVKIRVDFDRIGRSRNVEPLVVELFSPVDPDQLAAEIFAYARPYLASRNVEVIVDMEENKGWINVGFNNGGSFHFQAMEIGP